MFVLANGGYVFGGYNPVSWLSDFLYTETDESYLFQVFNPLHLEGGSRQRSLNYLLPESPEITDPQKRIPQKNPEVTVLPKCPVRCPIRLQKKDKAIKQNDLKYSPAFGEANVSDLFIAFKNPQNSYSMLGNVYKLPKGVSYKDSETWLAGKKDDWKV